MKKTIMMMAMSLAMVNPAYSMMNVSSVPYTHIADAVSNTGESESAFLNRLIPVFRGWADKTHTEACAEIGKSGDGRYGVVIGSNHSHLGCIAYHDKLIAGMTDTNISVHTHGTNKVTYLTPDDFKLASLQNGGVARFRNGSLRPRIGGQDLYHFSVTDFEHPGYLITPTNVIYQNGPGTTVVVNP